jgi:hypothetical protein
MINNHNILTFFKIYVDAAKWKFGRADFSFLPRGRNVPGDTGGAYQRNIARRRCVSGAGFVSASTADRSSSSAR